MGLSIEEKTIFKRKVKHELRVKSSNARVTSSNPRVNFRCLARIELKPHTKVLKNHFYNTAFKNLCVINILPTYFSIGHKVRVYSPSMELTLSRWGVYPPRSSNLSASTRRGQLSVAVKAVRPTDLLNHVKTWVKTG